jgi:glucose-6-phosphate isomerase
MIKCDLTYAKLDVSVEDFQEKVSFYHHALHQKTGKGNDFLGWVDWPKTYDKDEFARIQEAAKRIRKDAEVFLVCGIGGSYLGARAAIEFVQGTFWQKGCGSFVCRQYFFINSHRSVVGVHQREECLL